MPEYVEVFRADFPVERRTTGVEIEERAKRESAVDINGVTSKRGAGVPLIRVSCCKVAILESKLLTVEKDADCACGE